MPPKILEFASLAREVRAQRRAGHRVTLVHGVFDDADRLDRGMLRSLRASSDVVVAVVPDDATLRDRELRLAEPERLRLAASLGEIDLVGLVPWKTASKAIVELEPDVYAFPSTGSEATGPTPDELDALATTGTELYTLSRRGDTVVEWRQTVERGTRDRQVFARKLRDTFTMDDVLTGLDAIRRLKVAVVGETIIDEYAYCDAIGKSGKEPIIVNRFLSCDAQAGGVLAVANHLAEFCDDVEVVSALGTIDAREDFIRSGLREEVRPTFVSKPGPTIVKRRYVDAYSRAKMMGVYNMDTAPISGAYERRFVEALHTAMDRADVVIVADYGHGLLTRRSVEALSERSRFLAVNTQLNAANSGYHVLSKYPRADYACLHEGELRLDARDMRIELAELVASTATRLQARALMATLGRRGTVLYHRDHPRDGGIFCCPAFASVVLERIGAGDAVLAASSVAVAANLAPDLVNLLGNLAGAQMVAVMGNSASIRKTRLIESARALLDPDALTPLQPGAK